MLERNYKAWLEAIDNNQKPITQIFTPKRNWRAFKDLGEMMELGFVDWKKLNNKYETNFRTPCKNILAQ